MKGNKSLFRRSQSFIGTIIIKNTNFYNLSRRSFYIANTFHRRDIFRLSGRIFYFIYIICREKFIHNRRNDLPLSIFWTVYQVTFMYSSFFAFSIE
ncbi:unknown [Bacteroides sp. CAG:462]|nr:unknown [Bacteroides sp. CAG:462]